MVQRVRASYGILVVSLICGLLGGLGGILLYRSVSQVQHFQWLNTNAMAIVPTKLLAYQYPWLIVDTVNGIRFRCVPKTGSCEEWNAEIPASVPTCFESIAMEQPVYPQDTVDSIAIRSCGPGGYVNIWYALRRDGQVSYMERYHFAEAGASDENWIFLLGTFIGGVSGMCAHQMAKKLQKKQGFHFRIWASSLVYQRQSRLVGNLAHPKREQD